MSTACLLSPFCWAFITKKGEHTQRGQTSMGNQSTASFFRFHFCVSVFGIFVQVSHSCSADVVWLWPKSASVVVILWEAALHFMTLMTHQLPAPGIDKWQVIKNFELVYFFCFGWACFEGFCWTNLAKCFKCWLLGCFCTLYKVPLTGGTPTHLYTGGVSVQEIFRQPVKI